ncbi:hypothetical protein M3212_14580 [Alkalihalobacillus oceani]|uniref:hypothetical protein n=1 Tax=Halalkalibacter oceani TaxID=1653776 RepID=UPI00203B22A1|nr:hypothetical protein [Halalkalibacter oceani]MCM3761999.1 hypothetical protein [Halalkalibacter oceani]
MQWKEVRQLYPNQWVQLEALKAHVIEDKKIIDEVALIKPIKTDQEATTSLLNSSGDTFVFHTSKPRIELNIVRKPSYRGIKSL